MTTLQNLRVIHLKIIELRSLKGDTFIKEETKALKGLIENFNPNRVTYNPSVNYNFDFIHQGAVVCDGTMKFIWKGKINYFIIY